MAEGFPLVENLNLPVGFQIAGMEVLTALLTPPVCTATRAIFFATDQTNFRDLPHSAKMGAVVMLATRKCNLSPLTQEMSHQARLQMKKRYRSLRTGLLLDVYK